MTIDIDRDERSLLIFPPPLPLPLPLPTLPLLLRERPAEVRAGVEVEDVGGPPAPRPGEWSGLEKFSLGLLASWTLTVCFSFRIAALGEVLAEEGALGKYELLEMCR